MRTRCPWRRPSSPSPPLPSDWIRHISVISVQTAMDGWEWAHGIAKSGLKGRKGKQDPTYPSRERQQVAVSRRASTVMIRSAVLQCACRTETPVRKPPSIGREVRSTTPLSLRLLYKKENHGSAVDPLHTACGPWQGGLAASVAWHWLASCRW